MSINIVSYNFIFILCFIIIFIISSIIIIIIIFIIIIIIILSYFATVETGHNVSSVVFLVF